jgi:hypothetical protein
MKNSDNNPVNGNGTTVHLAFLSGGPFDSLLEQIARARVSPSSFSNQLPVNAAETSASEEARPSPAQELVLANER